MPAWFVCLFLCPGLAYYILLVHRKYLREKVSLKTCTESTAWILMDWEKKNQTGQNTRAKIINELVTNAKITGQIYRNFLEIILFIWKNACGCSL